jgi:hypothetical protein
MSKFSKLATHHPAELLKTFHELFVFAVSLHRLFWFLQKHIDSLHILWIAKQFVYLLVRRYVVQKNHWSSISYGFVRGNNSSSLPTAPISAIEYCSVFKVFLLIEAGSASAI